MPLSDDEFLQQNDHDLYKRNAIACFRHLQDLIKVYGEARQTVQPPVQDPWRSGLAAS